MFVIKNIKRNYDCYLTENNTWEGLLKAKTFKTEAEAKAVLTEDGKIFAWSDIIGLKN